MPKCIVYTGWDGCGTTAAYAFFTDVGKSLGWKASQWVTAPFDAVASSMRENKDLDSIWDDVVKPYLLDSDFGAFSGWPYSLFFRQWDRDFDTKFIHAQKSVENWAYNELGSHWCRTIPSESYQDHVDYIYGARVIRNDTNTREAWQKWITRYKQHNADVTEYFSDKSDRYIYVNLDDTTNEEIGIGISTLIEVDYSSLTYPPTFILHKTDEGIRNPAEWNTEHITKMRNEQEFQTAWGFHKPHLTL